MDNSPIANVTPSRTEVDCVTPGLKVFPSTKNFVATFKGYIYMYHTSGLEKQIFRCSKNKFGCHARLHLSGAYKSVVCDTSAQPSSHNHSPDDALCTRKYKSWKLKADSKGTQGSTASIIASVIQHVPQEVQGSFPKFKALQRIVQRSRMTSQLPVIRGNSRKELPLLTGTFLTSSGEDFVKWDSGRSDDRIVLFSTDANLNCMQHLDHFFADGTFKSQPILFDQLFVIHGIKTDGNSTLCVPLIFCLTPNRTTFTYVRIFSKIKELQPNFAPISIMTDYEQALLKAFKNVFPEADQRGCYFHYRQANFRRIQSCPDLLEKTTDGIFSLHLRTLIALAFVPPSHVVATFDELDASQFFQDNRIILDNYLDYFLTTWIGGFDRRGNRKAPLFPIVLWNCYDSVLQGLPKTNNFCEGFHRGFSSLLSVHHPSIPKFAAGLLKQQTLTEFRSELFTASQLPPPPPSQVNSLRRLKVAVERFGQVPNLDFLRGVAHCLKF